jgi:hypothetical protein
MLGVTVHLATTLADPSTTGVSNWIKGNVAPLVVFVIGLLLMLKSRGGDNAGALKMTGPLIMGLGIVGLALTNSWEPFSKFLIGLLGG